MAKISMIWQPRRMPCFFMHIPKTAGMSIRQAIAQQYDVREKLPAESWEELRQKQIDPTQYLLWVGHFRFFFRDMLPEGTYTFTIFRDPALRTLSHLRHLSADPSFNELHGLAKNRDIRSLIEDPFIISQCANTQVAYLANPRAPLERTIVGRMSLEDTLVGPPDLASAIENLKKLSFVGYHDALQDDFGRICADLCLHPPQPLNTINAATERNQPLEATVEIMEMLRAANDLDYVLLQEARKLRKSPTPLKSRLERCFDLIKNGTYHVIREDIEFPMSGPLPSVGLWFQEPPDKGTYRWTGPDTRLIFEVALDPHTQFYFEVSFACPHAIGTLSAYVNGEPVPLVLKQLTDHLATAQIHLSPKLETPITQIEIRCQETSRPNPLDNRRLGFVIHHLSIRRKRPGNPSCEADGG